MKISLSIEEARRLALHAQGFGGDRTGQANWSAIKRELQRLHLLQIDSVNVLVRQHYLPLFSRLGSYDRTVLDKRSLERKNRALFECWAHEASLVRMDLHPLMRWRMERARNGDGIYKSMAQMAREEKAFLKRTLDFIRDHGPIAQSDLPGSEKGAGGWWGWSKGKLTLETLFAQGHVTTSHRESFERFYDLTERVIPSEIMTLPTPNERESIRELTRLSAEALGIGTAFDLRDYFRLPVAQAARALQDCLEAGDIEPVDVDGWSQKAFVAKSARLPRKATATALVSPFDPIVWDRDRAERLFNFHYRIELYTPESKRKYGYYVLPFLHDEAFAGRVCLKADRATSTLRVNHSYSEAEKASSETVDALADEISLIANWLSMERVDYVSGGRHIRALAKNDNS
jgi:uncharacterized protein